MLLLMLLQAKNVFHRIYATFSNKPLGSNDGAKSEPVPTVSCMFNFDTVNR